MQHQEPGACVIFQSHFRSQLSPFQATIISQQKPWKQLRQTGAKIATTQG
jgi:hypothetical protein